MKIVDLHARNVCGQNSVDSRPSVGRLRSSTNTSYSFRMFCFRVVGTIPGELEKKKNAIKMRENQFEVRIARRA